MSLANDSPQIFMCSPGMMSLPMKMCVVMLGSCCIHLWRQGGPVIGAAVVGLKKLLMIPHRSRRARLSSPLEEDILKGIIEKIDLISERRDQSGKVNGEDLSNLLKIN